MSDLYVMGTGVLETTQLTKETIQILEKCRGLFVLHYDANVLESLSKYTSCEIHDLASFYEEKQLRQDAYHAIAEHLVSVAKSIRPIAFMVQGHPLFLVSACEYTAELAVEKGLSVRLVPAVSSFDTILCDLGIDLGYAVQLFDATTLIEGSLTVNPRVPLLVFQLATVLNPNIIRGQPRSHILKPLKDYLLQWYPPQHECKLVQSRSFVLEPATIETITIDELSDCAELDLTKRPTLYVPEIDKNR